MSLLPPHLLYGGENHASIQHIRTTRSSASDRNHTARFKYQNHRGGNRHTSQHTLQMENHPQPSIAGEGRQTASVLYGAGAAAVGVGRPYTTTSIMRKPQRFLPLAKIGGFHFFIQDLEDFIYRSSPNFCMAMEPRPKGQGSCRFCGVSYIGFPQNRQILCMRGNPESTRWVRTGFPFPYT